MAQHTHTHERPADVKSSRIGLGWVGLGRGKNSYLPATDTEQEANHIGLLLLLEFFHVLEGTHLEREKETVSNWTLN